MTHKLLFVDDERHLLNGIERVLGFDYELDTAESGQEGLDAIRERGPYSVVFTDMRMPHMDGMQFLEKARQLAPNSIYVMLTGNNDLETAVNAINQGQVFRFLNKPCEEQELSGVIQDALRQFELVQAEKELLHDTFVGSVRVMTDVIDAIQPELAGRGERIQENIAALCQGSGIEERWEFKLAGRLSTLGVALLPESYRLCLERNDHDSAIAIEVSCRAAKLAGTILQDVPRLKDVAEICKRREHTTNGLISTQSPSDSEEIVSVGVVLLQAASLWEELSRRGLAASEIRETVHQLLPQLPDAMLKLMGNSDASASGCETIGVSPERLEEGMVVGEDVPCPERGELLIRKGQRLNQVTIQKLQSYEDLLPLSITTTSAGDQSQVAATL